MMNQQTQKREASDLLLDPDQLKNLFIIHLNNIHCAKAHLRERLPELAEHADFQDLKNAIFETCDDMGKQIARIDKIYELLDESPKLDDCDELIQFVEDVFHKIYQRSDDKGMRDLSILFYFSLIDNIQLSSLKILQLTAVKFPDKQIKQLLLENFDESTADQVLLHQITALYIS